MIFKNIKIELIKIIQFNIIFIFIFLKMSDFEYEYNSNSDNDNDNISYDYSMSDTNYSDDDIENDLIESKTNFIIDMDEDNSSTNTTHSNKKHTSIINNSKPMINNFDSLFNNEETVIDDKSKHTEQNKTKGKKIQLKKTETKTEKKNEGKNKDKIEDKPDKTIIKEVKLTKKEQNFEFNQENIDFYTILIKKSPFTNDIQVICLLLKHKIISDYCCSVDKCKVKNLWINNPIQLILHRKNNIQNDLSSFNLELICGNCYLAKYGLDIFKKKEKEIIFKCNICEFPLVKFNNTRKKKGICLSCEKKMNNVFNENIDGKFYSKIQGLYNDNPLLSEEHKEANYYKNTGKSKYSSTYKKPNYSMSSQETNSKNNEPIVSLNLTLPKIDDLIN